MNEESKKLTLVIIESPFAGLGSKSEGEFEKNIRYVRAALRDCLLRGEAPIASHALYTLEGVLDDTNHVERRLGIEAGLAWGRLAEVSVVYVDRGISKGMREGIERARAEGRPVDVRRITGWDIEPLSVEDRIFLGLEEESAVS